MWISLYLGPQCFCCIILRDVIFVEACSTSVISMTCILQHAVVCWVTAQPSQSQSSGSTDDENHKAWVEDARNIITQKKVNKACYAWKEENYEDDKTEMGALCFTRRVRRTRVPKGFKLPHDQQKYDGSQEPRLWLSDYLQAVKILGGTRATAMQSLQLHLTGAARSWLSILPNESIRSWGELENQFARNFHSTYKRPASIEEVKSCTQGKGKTLRWYIQWWSIIKKLHRRRLRRAGSRCFFGWPSPFGPRGRIGENKAQNGVRINRDHKQIRWWRRRLQQQKGVHARSRQSKQTKAHVSQWVWLRKAQPSSRRVWKGRRGRKRK
jgi:hypothetical protein